MFSIKHFQIVWIIGVHWAFSVEIYDAIDRASIDTLSQRRSAHPLTRCASYDLKHFAQFLQGVTPPRCRPSCDFPVTFTETRWKKNARKPQAVPKKRGQQRRARRAGSRHVGDIANLWRGMRYRERRELVSTRAQRKRERVKGNGESLLGATRHRNGGGG